jgi:hypothetical protein
MEILSVHLVVCKLFCLYGAEGAESHVESYLTVTNAFFTDFRKKLV